MRDLTRRESRERCRRPPRRRNSRQAFQFVQCGDDDLVFAPGAAAPSGGVANRHDGAAIQADALELALGEERDRRAVRRKEEVQNAVRALERGRRGLIEPSREQTPVRHEDQPFTVRRDADVWSGLRSRQLHAQVDVETHDGRPCRGGSCHRPPPPGASRAGHDDGGAGKYHAHTASVRSDGTLTACRQPMVDGTCSFECEREIARRLETALQRLLETMANETVERRRNSRGAVRRFGWFLVEYRVDGIGGRVAVEGALAVDHFMENRAKAEDVTPLINGEAAHLLGRHVTNGAHHQPRIGFDDPGG